MKGAAVVCIVRPTVEILACGAGRRRRPDMVLGVCPGASVGWVTSSSLTAQHADSMGLRTGRQPTNIQTILGPGSGLPPCISGCAVESPGV